LWHRPFFCRCIQHWKLQLLNCKGEYHYFFYLYFLSWSNKELRLTCQNVYLQVLYLRMTGLSLQNMFIITTGETTVSLQIPHRSHKSNILYAGLVQKTISFSGTICRSRVSKHFHKKKYYHSY
jgi:hypothetical protein